MQKSTNNAGKKGTGIGRRHLLKGAGVLLGAEAAAAPSASADDEDSQPSIEGLWGTVVSSPGLPSFQALETFGGGGVWTGSGQTNLTPAALASTAWGVWTSLGNHKFKVIARFWIYTPTAVPVGYAAINFTYTLSADGKHYAGVGTTSSFDTNNNPLGPPAVTYDNGVRIA